ncbi:glycosyltransferase family 2 protein [Roseospirillum parvum]|uniref:Glycosyl transferase family 2 n=1 Tax=Roseospirillum parvum TaxID=83401 RepID=A0A1G7TVF1_9PROT|nr:glycosyltransferase [Roseospirillum parvum]SDG39243.1 Glycosyl transferase family 2 [Roseospirillum parvum]
MANVAVITRTKDRPLLLPRAILSVATQTYGDLEHVIVNDGGDPAPVEALIDGQPDPVRRRIRIIHNAESRGMERASNIGIAASDSRHLVIHDDDDSWDPKFLARMVPCLEEATWPSLAGAVCHSARVEERVIDGPEGPSVKTDNVAGWNTALKTVGLMDMLAWNQFPPISFLFERRALDQVGPYREDLPVLGDWEFNVRFLSAFDILVVPQVLARYHHRLTGPPGQETIYDNTVTVGADRHQFYETLLRNEWLRADLKAGRLGLGMAANVARQVVGAPKIG